MKKLFAMAVALALLAGCASTRPPEKTDAEARIAEARATEVQSFNQAMSTLASGEKVGDGPRTAALMLMFTRQQSLNQSAPAMSRPPDWLDRSFQLADFLLRGYQIERGASVAMRQSDNNRDIQLGAFGAFEGIAGQIQAPAAPQANQTTQTWTTLTQTASGAGSAAGGGAGSYSAPTATTTTSSVDNHAVSGSYNPVDTVTYPIAP